MGPSHVLNEKSCFDLNKSNSLFVLLNYAKSMELLLRLCEHVRLNLEHSLLDNMLCTAGKAHCTCKRSNTKGGAGHPAYLFEFDLDQSKHCQGMPVCKVNLFCPK